METIKITEETQGYLWYSDSTQPQVYDNNECKEIKLDNSSNPFIVEGELFDNHTLESTTIKYIDGVYMINRHTVKSQDFNSTKVTIQNFLPNRMEAVGYLQFLQYWEGVPDEYCEGMQVLQPKEFVFVGFNKKQEE